ncbi:MAG: radical SAM family heme chaperone HemW [Oscillospiraceae bacterium]|nr:radical SAM family heme chaperone HemW [Oscillospiraceae bacterium]
MNTLGVYIHVPFCASKCGYCSFHSAPAGKAEMQQYTEKIQQAIAVSPYEYSGADTVYFGGGTPSLLAPQQIIKCLEAVKQRYPLTNDCEVTMEANPASITAEKLDVLRNGGVNRLSIGIQSLDDAQLKILGRRHNAAQACEAIIQAKQAGFNNISADLMLGLPGQTKEHIKRFAEVLADLGVDHISSYILKIEEGTPFERMNIAQQCPDEDECADIYLETVELLEKYGFKQYEISNFAKNGNISRHNTRYWKCMDYLGIGPSAHSFVKGERFYFPADNAAFMSAEDVWNVICSDGTGGDWEEYCMLALRLTEGIDLCEAKQKYPEAEWQRFINKTGIYIKNGYMQMQDNRLSFTPNGFLVSNDILASLLL